MTYRQDIGRRGEDLACEFLIASGFFIRERNFQTKFGEIDIVAVQRVGGQRADGLRLQVCDGTETVVFVEVKTRTSSAFGTPTEAFDGRKRHKFERAIFCYLADYPEVRDWRIDFIGVTLDRGGRMIYREHIQNIES